MFYTKERILDYEVFGILIILWKCHSWIESRLFYVSDLKKLDKSSFYVMLCLSEHFHQKIRQHAIVSARTTLHLLIYMTFLLSLQSNFVSLLWCCKDC